MSPVQPEQLEAEVTPDELAERLALLQGVSVFFPVPDRQMRRLARMLRRAAVPANEEIVTQGFVSDQMYIIVSGRCEVRASWEGNHRVTVSVLGPGDFFGLTTLREGVPQPASVTTTERCVVLELRVADIGTVIGPGSPARAEIEKLAEQLQTAIDQVIGRADLVASGREARVIAIYSPKGGAGKTTLAVNIAAAIGQQRRGEVVLLDLGLPYNHAALMANLVPTGCLAQLERVADQDLEEMMLSACMHHPSGMLVLPGTLRVEQSELITPHLVLRAMGVLARSFAYVVIDLGVAISEAALAVLEHATKVVVVVTPEVSALRDTKNLIELMRSVLNIPENSICIAVNRPRPSSGLERTDIEANIGRPVDFDLEHDGPRADRASVTGELLVVAAPTTSLARHLRALALEMADLSEAPVRPLRNAR